MSSAVKAASTPAAGKHRSHYLGGLDGLRFLAFLLVFGNHMPGVAAVSIFSTHGWVGVELFFAISAFLLFSLLDAEEEKDGQVNIRNFYFRRVLRIYPLLITFYVITFIVREGFLRPMAWARLGTTLGSVDNIAAWWWGYNYTIQGVGPLWSLSFEFQIYLLLPFAFLAWKRWGTRPFLLALLVIEIVTFAVRVFALKHGGSEIGLYVIPYFRPDSILMGLALAVIRPKWNPWLSFVVGICAGVVFFVTNDPTHIYDYAPAAIMAAGFVDAGVRLGPFQTLLAWRPLRYLGTISFGLYVFHVDAIWTVVRILQMHRLQPYDGFLNSGPMIAVLSLVLTIVAAAISYRFLERPFLTLKRRFTSVEGRSA